MLFKGYTHRLQTYFNFKKSKWKQFRMTGNGMGGDAQMASIGNVLDFSLVKDS